MTDIHAMEQPTRKRLLVYSGTAHPQLAEDVVGQLGLELGEPNIRRFANGEIHCRYGESIRGADVFIIQSHAGPHINAAIMEQLIASKPDYWAVHYNAGCFEALAGDKDAAFAHLRRARELEPGHPAGQRGEHDAHLQPGDVRAQAQVRPAAAEGQVPVGGAADVECVWRLELGLIPVSRHIPEHHLVAGLDARAAQLGAGRRGAPHEVGRAGPPQHLLGRRVQQAGVGAQPVPLLRVLAERQDALGDGDPGGLVPGDDHDREEVVEVGLAELVAVHLGPQQRGQQVVAG